MRSVVGVLRRIVDTKRRIDARLVEFVSEIIVLHLGNDESIALHLDRRCKRDNADIGKKIEQVYSGIFFSTIFRAIC